MWTHIWFFLEFIFYLLLLRDLKMNTNFTLCKMPGLKKCLTLVTQHLDVQWKTLLFQLLFISCFVNILFHIYYELLVHHLEELSAVLANLTDRGLIWLPANSSHELTPSFPSFIFSSVAQLASTLLWPREP